MCVCENIQNLDDHMLANPLVTSHYLAVLTHTHTHTHTNISTHAYRVTLY